MRKIVVLIEFFSSIFDAVPGRQLERRDFRGNGIQQGGRVYPLLDETAHRQGPDAVAAHDAACLPFGREGGNRSQRHPRLGERGCHVGIPHRVKGRALVLVEAKKQGHRPVSLPEDPGLLRRQSRRTGSGRPRRWSGRDDWPIRCLRRYRPCTCRCSSHDAQTGKKALPEACFPPPFRSVSAWPCRHPKSGFLWGPPVTIPAAVP